MFGLPGTFWNSLLQLAGAAPPPSTDGGISGGASRGGSAKLKRKFGAEPSAIDDSAWGSSGDPFAQFDLAAERAGVRKQGSDWFAERPDSPGDWAPVQSVQAEDLVPAAPTTDVTIDGQWYTRIGNLANIAAKPEWKELIRSVAIYDPELGFLVPRELVGIAQHASYTGGGGGTLSGILVNAPTILAMAVLGLVAAGAASGLVGAGAVGAEGAAAPGMFDTILQGAGKGAVAGGVRGAAGSAISGENPLLGAARGAATGGVTGGVQTGSSMLGDAFDEWLDSVAASGEAPLPIEQAMNAPGGYSPAPTYQSAEGMLFGQAPQPVAMSPAVGEMAPVSAEQMLLYGPPIVPGMLQSTPSTPSAKAPEAKPGPAKSTLDQAQRAYKVYQQLAGSKDVQPFQIPERGEGQSDADYAAEVGQAAAEYLSLNPEDMRKAGLEPGSPDYLNYILEQADSIIDQIFGEDSAALLSGESPDDLKAALRDLTDKEAQQLMRALYVRGALGQVSTQPSAVDPFTGLTEELGLLPGETAKGPEAARQRGYARSVEELAGKRGPAAREQLGGLLGRNVDLFGMQEAADARAEQARLVEIDDEDQKRRRKRPDDEDEDFFRSIGWR